jgi:hypothetical protein
LPSKVASFIRPVKNDLGSKTPGVYRIRCTRGKVCIGQTGRLIETKIKEHHRHIRFYHPEKSAVAEHITDLGHHVQFQDTSILVKKPETWNA